MLQSMGLQRVGQDLVTQQQQQQQTNSVTSTLSCVAIETSAQLGLRSANDRYFLKCLEQEVFLCQGAVCLCVCVCVCVCVCWYIFNTSQVVDNSALVFTPCSKSARDEWLGLSQAVPEHMHRSMPEHGLLDFLEYAGVFQTSLDISFLRFLVSLTVIPMVTHFLRQL